MVWIVHICESEANSIHQQKLWIRFRYHHRWKSKHGIRIQLAIAKQHNVEYAFGEWFSFEYSDSDYIPTSQPTTPLSIRTRWEMNKSIFEALGRQISWIFASILFFIPAESHVIFFYYFGNVQPLVCWAGLWFIILAWATFVCRRNVNITNKKKRTIKGQI